MNCDATSSLYNISSKILKNIQGLMHKIEICEKCEEIVQSVEEMVLSLPVPFLYVEEKVEKISSKLEIFFSSRSNPPKKIFWGKKQPEWLIIISKIDILKKKNGFCSEMTKYYVDLFYWKGINFNSY